MLQRHEHSFQGELAVTVRKLQTWMHHNETHWAGMAAAAGVAAAADTTMTISLAAAMAMQQ